MEKQNRDADSSSESNRQQRKRSAQQQEDSTAKSRVASKTCSQTGRSEKSVSSASQKGHHHSPSSSMGRSIDTQKDMQKGGIHIHKEIHMHMRKQSRSSFDPAKIRTMCYETAAPMKRTPCRMPKPWQQGKYVKDECGSGIVPTQHRFRYDRSVWCKTPLTMYQSTIGELGKQILCSEVSVNKDVKPEPPCHISEIILPLCRGYYRKKPCLRPCEEDFVKVKQGRRIYRNCFERYWQPCLTHEEKVQLDVNSYAPQNVALGLKMRRKLDNEPCW